VTLLCIGALVALSAVGCGSDSDGSNADPTTTTKASTGVTEPASQAQPPTAADLDGRTFVSQDVTGYDLADGSTVNLTFTGGQMSASGGCNTMTGAYKVDSGRLGWTGTPAGTMMACDDAAMAQDQWVATWLTDGVEASLDGDTLTLSSDDVTMVLVDDASGATDVPLVGTAWTLESLVDGETASSVPAGVEPPTLNIEPDGNAAVFTGCNRGNSHVTVADDGATATFGPMAMTRMACGDDASSVEAAVTSVLDGEVTVNIDGDQLTLANGDQSLIYEGS